MSRLLHLVLAGSLPLWSQCRFAYKQEDPQPAKVLPPATEQGLNTLGFLVNDTVWLPQGHWTRDRMGGGYAFGAFRVFSTYVALNGKGHQTFGMTVGDARSGAGKYPLYVPLGVTLGWRISRASFSRGIRSYETDAKHPGTVTITRLDLVQRIVSGTFEFTAMDRVSGDSVRITQGRFDLQY
jgi:hypothetical protein